MLIGIDNQLKFLISVILSGMLCGVVYDIIRARRKLFDFGNICVNIEDIIFCIFTGIVFLSVTFHLNSGIIRISGFFGIILGEFIYYLLLRNYIRNFFIYIAKKIYTLFIIIIKIFLLPIRILKHLLRKPVHITIWYINRHLRKNKSIILLLLERIKQRVKILKLFMVKRGKKH